MSCPKNPLLRRVGLLVGLSALSCTPQGDDGLDIETVGSQQTDVGTDASSGAGGFSNGDEAIAVIASALADLAVAFPNATIASQCGTDVTQCCDAANTVTGTAGEDKLKSKAGKHEEGTQACVDLLGDDDNYHGKFANDFVYGGFGDDDLFGHAGNDVLVGGDGNDVLRGGPDDDVLLGGLGEDVLDGGPGDDVLLGGSGNDDMRGGPGSDLLVPGPGTTEADGGPGDDVVIISGLCAVTETARIDGGPGFDRLLSPVSESELEALGVDLRGFEDVVVYGLGEDGCLGTGLFLTACECCASSGVDPQQGCSSCVEGFVSTAPFVEGDTIPPRESILKCRAAATCDTLACGDHGTCIDHFDGNSEEAECQCQPGHAGAFCEGCQVGFELDGNDECVPSASCGEDFCGGNGTCLAGVGGKLTCDCASPYSGDNCEICTTCAAGDPVMSGGATWLSPGDTAQFDIFDPNLRCTGPWDWTTNRGTVNPVPGTDSIIYEAGGLGGEHHRMARVTAECSSDNSFSLQRFVDITDGVPVTGVPRPALAGFDELAVEYLKFFRIQTGATMIVLKDGNVVHKRGYGVDAKNNGEAMTPCTPMRLASGTKYYTRSLYRYLSNDDPTNPTLQLVGGATQALQGLIGIDQIAGFRSDVNYTGPSACPDLPGIDLNPNGCFYTDFSVPESRYNVGDWQTPPEPFAVAGTVDRRFPWVAAMGEDPTQGATIDQLAAHSSGLLSNVLGDHPNLPDPSLNKQALANALGVSDPNYIDVIRYGVGASLQFRPGGQVLVPTVEPISGYSNVGYVLLARILELAVNGGIPGSYESILRTRLFGPAPTQANPAVGTNPDSGLPIVYAGKSLLADTEPFEPEYADRDGSPEAIDLGLLVGAGDLVANTTASGALLASRRVNNGQRYTNLPSAGGGLQQGQLTGTRSYHLQMPQSSGFAPFEVGPQITPSGAACVDNANCLGGEFCSIPPGSSVGACTRRTVCLVDANCSTGDLCLNNTCTAVRPCTIDEDCLDSEHYTCVVGQTGAGECTLTNTTWEEKDPCGTAGGINGSDTYNLPTGVSVAFLVAERPTRYETNLLPAGVNQCGEGEEIGAWSWIWFKTRIARVSADLGSTWPAPLTTNQLDATCNPCGNGVIDPGFGEECDGNDLPGLTCTDLTGLSGTLGCTDTCEIDTTGCTCGDGVLDASEECDDTALGGQTCQTVGNFGFGTLGCSANCRFDVDDCGGVGGGPGTCTKGEIDCECEDIAQRTNQFPGDLYHGDGDFSRDLYCPDLPAGSDPANGEIVCSKIKDGGGAGVDVGRCKQCYDPDGDGMSVQDRVAGCPCTDTDECVSGLACLGTTGGGSGGGRCFDPQDSVPWWQCLGDCTAITGDPGSFCGQLDQAFASFCVTAGCSEVQYADCQNQSLACDYDSAPGGDPCRLDCSAPGDTCQMLGFPNEYVCSAIPGNCVLPPPLSNIP